MEITKSHNRKFLSAHLFRSFLAILTTLSLLLGCAGESRMSGGAKTGAIVGAGIGLLVGVLSGNAEKAVAATAIGAGLGAGEGAYQGWKQDQDDQRTKQITEAIRESKQASGEQPSRDAETLAREELTRFIGIWTMEGWVQEPGKEQITVHARVNADIQMSYFVELAYIDMKVAGLDKQVWGTSTIGYDKDNGYNITTRFNTHAEPVRAAGGTFSQESRSFTFKGNDFRFVVIFQTPDRFIVETFVSSGSGDQKVESYTFNRT